MKKDCVKETIADYAAHYNNHKSSLTKKNSVSSDETLIL